MILPRGPNPDGSIRDITHDITRIYIYIYNVPIKWIQRPALPPASSQTNKNNNNNNNNNKKTPTPHDQTLYQHKKPDNNNRTTQFLFSFYFIRLIIPFGKFGPSYLGKTKAAARAALPSPTCACWVFSCFRNPPNSDMDYMIFNVRT